MKQAEDPVCFTERQNKWNIIKELTLLCKKIYLIIIVTISILFFLLYRTKKFQIYQKTLKRGYFDMEKLTVSFSGEVVTWSTIDLGNEYFIYSSICFGNVIFN